MELTEQVLPFRELESLHNMHLEMLVWFRDFCRDNGICWCLAFGSALGAVRHGGPIPWDDDVDVILTAADWEKFRSRFRESGNHQDYYLQERVCIGGMVEYAKLRRNGTAFLEPGCRDLHMHHGIFMDIFILHNAPQGKLSMAVSRLAGIYTELKIMSNQGYDRKKSALPLMAFLRLFSPTFGLRTAFRLLYRYDSRPSDRLVSWGIPFLVYPRDMIFPLRRILYDGEPLYVPGRAEAYLRLVYGDWQILPDSEQIHWHRHTSQWSTTRDFREILPDAGDFSDEICIP